MFGNTVGVMQYDEKFNDNKEKCIQINRMNQTLHLSKSRLELGSSSFQIELV